MIYELSAQADQDVLAIYRYGFETFGEAQADKYYLAMSEAFEVIASDPLRFPEVQIKTKVFRKVVFRSNVIYFRILSTEVVRIDRVLGRQDLEAAFG